MEPTNGKSSVRIITYWHTPDLPFPDYSPRAKANIAENSREKAEIEIAELMSQGYEIATVTPGEEKIHFVLVKENNVG